jgi:hypothetical protein
MVGLWCGNLTARGAFVLVGTVFQKGGTAGRRDSGTAGRRDGGTRLELHLERSKGSSHPVFDDHSRRSLVALLLGMK